MIQSWKVLEQARKALHFKKAKMWHKFAVTPMAWEGGATVESHYGVTDTAPGPVISALDSLSDGRIWGD